jgi:hypothetical protein
MNFTVGGRNVKLNDELFLLNNNGSNSYFSVKLKLFTNTMKISTEIELQTQFMVSCLCQLSIEMWVG